MALSPTSRTLEYYRKLGATVAIVEKRIPYKFITQDLFGFIDILAISPEGGIVGVQCTSDSNVAARVDKIYAEPRAKTWLLSGGKIRVIGWSKKGSRGKRKTWQPRVVPVEVIP